MAQRPAVQDNLESPIAAFIEYLPEDEVDQLYSDFASVCFVFRLLDPMAQQIVIRFAFAGPNAPFQEGVLLAWVASAAMEKYTAAMQSLRRFRILVDSLKTGSGRKDGGAATSLRVNKNFQRNLSQHVAAGVTTSNRVSRVVPSAHELHRHAAQSWDTILGHLIGSTTDAPISKEVASAIQSLGLKHGQELSSLGFRFVLYQRQQQLWAFVINLLQEAARSKLHLDPLMLLLGFASAKVGKFLDVRGKSPYALKLVQLLCDVGALLCVHDRRDLEYFATPALLAMFRPVSALISRSIMGGRSHVGLPQHLYEKQCGQRPGVSANNEKLHEEEYGIIVESNFKVYAHTSSSLQARLLEYFCRITSTLPHLVVGSLSSESVMKAFKLGICAETILGYLESAAHPRALKRKEHGAAVIPDNVRGQLEVWESNRSRTTSWKAVRITWKGDASSQCEFERARAYSKDDGSFLWCQEDVDGQGALLIVTAEGAQRLRFFLSGEEDDSDRRVRARLETA
jgi:transcription initiation factor TFIIH subunit 4